MNKHHRIPLSVIRGSTWKAHHIPFEQGRMTYKILKATRHAERCFQVDSVPWVTFLAILKTKELFGVPSHNDTSSIIPYAQYCIPRICSAKGRHVDCAFPSVREENGVQSSWAPNYEISCGGLNGGVALNATGAVRRVAFPRWQGTRGWTGWESSWKQVEINRIIGWVGGGGGGGDEQGGDLAVVKALRVKTQMLVECGFVLGPAKGPPSYTRFPPRTLPWLDIPRRVRTRLYWPSCKTPMVDCNPATPNSRGTGGVSNWTFIYSRANRRDALISVSGFWTRVLYNLWDAWILSGRGGNVATWLDN